jgi:hypothetical protein
MVAGVGVHFGNHLTGILALSWEKSRIPVHLSNVECLELSFQSAGHQPAQKEAPQEDVNQKRGQCSQERPSHLDVPFHDLAAGQVLQGDRDRPGPGTGKGHGEQELVPDGRKLPDDDDDETGDGQWQHHVPVNAQEPGPGQVTVATRCQAK